MDEEKAQRLREAGWTVGSAAEFLELSEEEMADIKAKALREQVKQICDEFHDAFTEMKRLGD
jgi:hypothetical protein